MSCTPRSKSPSLSSSSSTSTASSSVSSTSMVSSNSSSPSSPSSSSSANSPRLVLVENPNPSAISTDLNELNSSGSSSSNDSNGSSLQSGQIETKLIENNLGDTAIESVPVCIVQPTKPAIQQSTIPLKLPKLRMLHNSKLFFAILDLVFKQYGIDDQLQKFTLALTRMSDLEILPMVEHLVFDVPTVDPYNKLKVTLLEQATLHFQMKHHLRCDTPNTFGGFTGTTVGSDNEDIIHHHRIDDNDDLDDLADLDLDDNNDDDDQSLDFETAENSCIFQDSEEIPNF